VVVVWIRGVPRPLPALRDAAARRGFSPLGARHGQRGGGLRAGERARGAARAVRGGRAGQDNEEARQEEEGEGEGQRKVRRRPQKVLFMRLTVGLARGYGAR